MRWNYNDEFRDEFSKGPHRDILIVPHGTKVTPVAGGPPEITSRVPLFNDDGTPQTDGQGNFVMSDVDWVITNKDIVKEQFKYSYSLNPAENITFSSASSAMVQFTIRNNKEYNPDTDTWELDIPNLQYYSYYDKNNNLIIGELEGNYIIKVYTYINGDSSTLLCLGMFRVEEDKAVDNGYNRQITAYDFMATFRDMDIFNWYKRLFDGINKLDNDYIDATNKTGEEQKKPDDYDANINWVRKPSKKLYPNRDGRWTIGEALQDLINNLAAFDMIVWSNDGKTAMVGGTSTNPSAVGRDYGEGCGYSGYGMPIVIDPNILDKNAKPYTPTEPGQDEYEEYGYMKILELEFYPDPSVLKSGSLSMGKFLEDIGILAGRYPMIRPDKLIEDSTADYFDPRTVTDPKQTRYNTYEKCILTFKPLPTSKDDKTDAGIPKLQPEQQLDNHDIAKGFEHALFDVKDVMIVKIGMQDGEKIEYKILNKTQRKQAETNDLQTFSFSNNLFCSYLVDSSDDEEIKKLLPEYKKIKEKLFGKEKDNHNMTSGALFEDGYYNIKNRSYVPYTLTTYGDPVRDVGDRILINFEDKITGEKTQIYTYILERELSGIQKMMDTYKANGQITSPVFSNYQTGSTYQSGFGMNIQMLGYKHSYGKGSGSSQGKVVGVSPSDLVSYLRNVGIRLLDEPLTASAKFVAYSTASEQTFYYAFAEKGYYDDNDDWIETWDGVEPTNGDTSTHGLYWNNPEELGEPKFEPWEVGWYQIEADQPLDYWYDYEFPDIGYIYSLNGEWVKHEKQELLSRNYKYEIEPYDLAPNDTTNTITINGITIKVKVGECLYYTDTDINGLNNFITGNNIREAYYAYPGVWTTNSQDSHVDEWKYLIEPGNGASYTASYKIIPRYVISPVMSIYDAEYTDTSFGWMNAALPFDNMAKEITINGKYNVDIPYGTYIKYDEVYTNITGHVNIGYHEDHYIYPGIWVDNSSWVPFGYNNEAQTLISPSNPYVEIKWEDPGDITTYEPTPATWKGTIVIRKEGIAPKHRWDGKEIIRTTTSNKDAYKTDAYKDTNVETNKIYYYGFFPYYKAREEDGHNINFFRYTKVIKVDTTMINQNTGLSATITNVSASEYNNDTMDVYYTIPEGNYRFGTLFGKLDADPSCDVTDDIYEYINLYDDHISLSDLGFDETYHFCLELTTFANNTTLSKIEEGTTAKCVEIYDIKVDYDQAEGNACTIYFKLADPSERTFDSVTIYGKQNTEPSFDNTDDIIEVVQDLYSDNSYYIENLHFNSTYYFGIKAILEGETYTSETYYCDTAYRSVWTSVELHGDSSDHTIPILIDNNYLEEYGSELNFGMLDDPYDTICDLDTTKITNAGKKLDMDYFMNLAKSLPYDTSTITTIYDNGVFSIDIYLYNSEDWGVISNIYSNYNNDSYSYFARSGDFPANDSMSFGFVETDDVQDEGHPGAAAIYYQASDGNWRNTSGNPSELYEIIHGLS